jgi:hypothetical protein
MKHVNHDMINASAKDEEGARELESITKWFY